jgi:hypothetical protein
MPLLRHELVDENILRFEICCANINGLFPSRCLECPRAEAAMVASSKRRRFLYPMKYSCGIFTQDYSVIKPSLLVQGVLGLVFPALAQASRNTFSSLCVFPSPLLLAFENQESTRKQDQPAKRHHLHKSKTPPSLVEHKLVTALGVSRTHMA